MLSKNSYYEGLLQDLFCGKDGFFVHFFHFFYQYNQILVYYDEYSELFKKLYLTELSLCEELSSLLIRLGGDPKFYSSSKRFVSGGEVDYIKNINNIFEYDISLLDKNCIDLKSAMLKIENIEIKKSLKNILEKLKNILKEFKDVFIDLKNKN